MLCWYNKKRLDDMSLQSLIGLLNKEQWYFITTIEDDIEFVKRDLQDSIDVDNDIDDEVTIDIENFIKNNLLYISILPDFFNYLIG